MPARLTGRYVPPKGRPRTHLDDVALRLSLNHDQHEEVLDHSESAAVDATDRDLTSPYRAAFLTRKGLPLKTKNVRSGNHQLLIVPGKLTQKQIDGHLQKADSEERGPGRHAKGTTTPTVKRILSLIAKRKNPDDAWKNPTDTWEKVAYDLNYLLSPDDPQTKDGHYYRHLWDDHKAMLIRGN